MSQLIIQRSLNRKSILIVVLVLAFVSGALIFLDNFNIGSITGYSIAENEWEHSIQVTASVNDPIITETITFDNYKPSNCEDGILVTYNGEEITYEIINSTYENNICVEAMIQFNNSFYEPLINNETNQTINTTESEINNTINQTNTSLPDERINDSLNESYVNSTLDNTTQVNNSVSNESYINETNTSELNETVLDNTTLINDTNTTEPEIEEENNTESSLITGAAVTSETVAYYIYYGKIPQEVSLAISYGDLNQGKVVLNESVNWSQEIIVTNSNSFEVDKEIDLDLPDGIYNLKIYSSGELVSQSKKVAVNLNSGEEYNLLVNFRTSPVKLDIQETDLELASLLPPEARDIKVYSGNELIGSYRNLQEANLNLPGSGKKVFIYHNSSLTYSNFTVQFPFEEGMTLTKIKEGKELDAKNETEVIGGNLIWRISEL